MKTWFIKKSYLRLLAFELAVFVLLILLEFFSSLLIGYGMPVFIGIVLIAFKILFGFEKDRNYLSKEALLDVVIFLLVYFIGFYIIGIFIGFASPHSYFTFEGIIKYIIPIVLSISLQEYLRSMILLKCGNNLGIRIATTLLFIFMTVETSLSSDILASSNSLFLFISLVFLPAITSNILCTYLARNFGCKPGILYMLVTTLYIYILPIVPNPNEYIKAMLDFLLPIVLLIIMQNFVEKSKDDDITIDYRKKNYIYVIPAIISLILVYFISGYFKYYAIAIASASMEPNIHIGDVVVVNQKLDMDKLQVGDIIAFRTENTILVHRVYNIIDYDGELFIYTKGDNNDAVDPWIVKKDDIVGGLTAKINWVGLPTVWVNGALERNN